MTTLSEPLVTPKYDKWRQLVLGLICMAAISSPQYVWTLLTKPLAARLGVGLPELQVTFSLLIILQTFFSPFQGRLVEKFGPRRLIAIGTVMAGMSWVLSAQVKGLATLWLVYGCMGGLGTGIVYIGVVGLMVKWFPRQRGFAAGAVAAGYGMGAIITTFPISLSLTTNGLELNPAAVWFYFRPLRPRANHVYRLCAGGSGDDALAGVPGRSAAVCPALRGGVLWLGGDLLALPVDAH